MPDASPAPVPQPTVLSHIDDACRVLLIRHGRSADVVPGSPEAADPPLHERGVAQVDALAARLRGVELAAVASSHLRRAVDTAQALAEPRGLEVQRFEDLQEVLLGDWANGEFRRRAAARDPEWLAYARSGRWDTVPGSEGDDSLRRRTIAVVRALASQHIGATIAVCCHGGVINAVLATLMDTHRSFSFTIENTSVTAVQLVDDGSFHVEVVNDCSHLYDPVLATSRT